MPDRLDTTMLYGSAKHASDSALIAFPTRIMIDVLTNLSILYELLFTMFSPYACEQYAFLMIICN
jgi:hypothetical protein